ncbi:ABC transporter permease [Aeromicrobium duanguangcaii]|uniref:ABC transporter permease n=1 Tax=Aeromicrobium duanguangcaii TaxID=2968086 RepID=A0ABY5KBQ6_9ACTN|nr:ABC transporter permease [Aeromicrobium duanguangcaii]MCD9154699.1 ABC transporter permease [Aeromicrobium duanguangcaii]UUI67887.1 ABC transporter permease [Aeromicrobium duanguangcaii]
MIGRLLTGFAAAVIEAWHELRIHKLRVLLSLVGVGVAVAALSGTVAIADIGQQALVEQYERDGRPAMLSVYAYNPQDDTGSGAAAATVRPAVAKVTEQFQISHASMAGNTQLDARQADRASRVDLLVVDPPYAVMHRVVTPRGRWLVASDAANLSPAIVVDPRLLKDLGLAEARLPATIDLVGASTTVSATVVGVTATSDRWMEFGRAYLLADAYEHWFGATQPMTDASWKIWIPTEGSQELTEAIRRSINAELPGLESQVERNDYLAWGGNDDLDSVKWVVVAISSVILLLGALSLLNVSVITIQQRVREIGIRRSFGATSGRVFFSVVMESIVATFVAGLVGVMIAIALVNGPWTAEYVLEGVADPPPFPLSAAALGMGVSLLVGALAGVLPALVAVRVRIVDAIRF